MPEPKQKSVTKTQNKVMGRPTKFTPELAALICEGITLGYSIRTVCKPDEMPAISTFYRWLAEYDDFSKQYARACEERTEAMAEDLLDIADNGTNDYMETDDGTVTYNGDSVQRAKLRVDTRKWLMAKMKPKKYGDKMEIDNTHRIVQPILGGATDDKKVIDQE